MGSAKRTPKREGFLKSPGDCDRQINDGYYDPLNGGTHEREAGNRQCHCLRRERDVRKGRKRGATGGIGPPPSLPASCWRFRRRLMCNCFHHRVHKIRDSFHALTKNASESIKNFTASF